MPEAKQPKDLPAQKPEAARTGRGAAKTDARKAVEAIEVQDSRIATMQKKRSDLLEQVRGINTALEPLEQRLEYLLKDPALPGAFLERRRPIREAEGSPSE